MSRLALRTNPVGTAATQKQSPTINNQHNNNNNQNHHNNTTFNQLNSTQPAILAGRESSRQSLVVFNIQHQHRQRIHNQDGCSRN
jgi:hypothetical protein